MSSLPRAVSDFHAFPTLSPLTDVTATVNSALFPPESVVGYPGATATGVEPEAIQTAAAYAYNSEAAADFPLVVDKTEDHESLDIFKYWGNLSPW
jgi:hypothetical protein